MYQRDPRSYVYEDHGAFPSGHNSGGYAAANLTPQDSSSPFYTAPAHAAPIHDMAMPSDGVNPPFYRSMTPSIASPSRYPNTGRITEARVYGAHAYHGGSSSTSVSQPAYPVQNGSYPPQYPPSAEQRQYASGQRPQASLQFIPTPSEIAHSYSTYAQGTAPRSPVVDESYSSLDYTTPHSSMASSSHRPARIATGRPRPPSTVPTSPTSASSPSGERFPCEKCGKTFSRSHDRKRHHETQHTPIPVMHTCHHCQKEFSRADSLKRHLDNGCDMHLS
jgi:hypothetical protein